MAMGKVCVCCLPSRSLLKFVAAVPEKEPCICLYLFWVVSLN